MKVQNVRLVVSLWRFVVSSLVMSFRRFVMAFRRFGTPISEVDSADYQFDSSAGLLCRFVVSSCRFSVSSCRFVVSLCRFVVSTRPLREAIIRRTLHEVFTWFHALIHDVFVRNLLCAATEKGFFEKLPTAQHRTRVKSSEWAVSWTWKWNRMSSYTLWQSFVYSACIFVT